jgi:hypothetical protein
MQRFVDMVNQDYFKLLDLVTIARSRRHIEKYYDPSAVGRFPRRLPPRNEYPGIDTQEEFPDIGEINKRLLRLTLALYAPISYLLPEKRAAYAKKYDVKVKTGHSVFRQADREQQLVGLVRVNLLKRMESSDPFLCADRAQNRRAHRARTRHHRRKRAASYDPDARHRKP